jgi:alpha-L-fucosidase
MQQRLLEIGGWLEVNGDAIFETTTSARSCQYTQGARPDRQMGLAHSFQVAYRVMDLIGHVPKNGVASIEMFFTAKERNNVTFLYAITVGYPQGTLVIRDVQASAATQVHMLGLQEELLFDYDGADLHVLVPVLHPTLLPCSYAYTFRISHAILKDAGPGQPHQEL